MTGNLSVVVATYNRKEILLKTLEAYRQQTAAHGILELLVIDDGSTDGTVEAVSEFAGRCPFGIRCLHQYREGQAKGRNRAIRESKGGLMLMGDDDVIPAPTLVAEHLTWHEEHPALSDAVVGQVAWSPELSPTPFMEWLAQDGIITDYGHMKRGQVTPPHFYTGNISLKRDFLLQNGLFDEGFRNYGYEDAELGYRLTKKGLRLFYNPDALGYHYKRVSVADVWRRAELVETAYPIFEAKVAASRAPRPVEKTSAARLAVRKTVRAIVPLAAPIARLFDTQIALPWFVYRMFYYHYMVPKVKARMVAATN